MDTKNLLIRNYGVYGSEYETLSQDFVHCETIEEDSKNHNYHFDRHIHSHLFQIFFLKSGEIRFIADDSDHMLKGPCIVTVPENHQHESF